MHPQTDNFHGMITASDAMRNVFTLIERAARTDAPVLIRGATGTGKELVARAIHDISPRHNGPFRVVNCATLTPELLASELFGHVKGAFTGAVRSRRGLFALADRGTLFLDEVAELPINLQSQLLRVLETQSFVPVGATEAVQVNVRVLSATHKALRHQVEQGSFRRDLMHRIRVVPIFLPALVERGPDVAVLTEHFLDALNADNPHRTVHRVSPAAMAALQDYTWPGNIRELHNVLQAAHVLGEGEELTVNELTPELRGEPPAQDPSVLFDDERQRLLDALRQAGGRRAVAAELLGMHRTTLWRKLQEHHLT